MSDRALIVVVAGVLTGLTALLIAGHGPWAGTPLVSLGTRHGINAGDVPVLLSWAAGVAACAVLWFRSR